MSATDNTPHRAVQRGMNYPAVIPAAGMGTRFLPATKAIPKEMLPVVDRPAIQYVVEEAVGAGIDDVLFVVGRSKNPLVDHFDRVSDMEDLLQARGKLDLLAEVQRITELASFHFVRQAEPHGLGHAVLQARHHVRDSPFAVLLGDDIISDGDALLAHMMQVHQHTGANVVAVQEVPREQVSSYGVVALRESADPATSTVHPHDRWPALWVDTLVEKPAPAEAPSTLAVIGRYVLNPEVFEVLHRTGPGRGGEIQLTDALVEMAAHPEQYGGVVAVVHDGRRYDTGNKLEYLKATVELALAHPTLGPDLHDWLLTLAADLRDNPHPKTASHPALKPSTS